MFERFSRSWGLVKASGAVLNANRRLMVFPVLSSLCTLIVAASFLLPAYASGTFTHLDRGHLTPGSAALLFVFDGLAELALLSAGADCVCAGALAPAEFVSAAKA